MMHDENDHAEDLIATLAEDMATRADHAFVHGEDYPSPPRARIALPLPDFPPGSTGDKAAAGATLREKKGIEQ